MDIRGTNTAWPSHRVTLWMSRLQHDGWASFDTRGKKRQV